jgi:peptide chain release factor subunit 3
LLNFSINLKNKKENMADNLTNSFSKMKFNAEAEEFVPSWLKKTPAPAPAAAPAPAPAPVEKPVEKPAPAPEKPKVQSPAVEDKPKSQPSTPKNPGSPAVHNIKNEYKRTNSQDFELPKDMKENLNIVFIGHVDAGKSTMGGQILYLTGMVDQRTLDKLQREAKEIGRDSWYLSWALDLNQEERNKGKTVECGKAIFETEKRRFTILDAPGHKNYVPSMISGASQADIGVLVISARKGEFETGFERGGQTREHAMLAKTAGVKKLIIVVNKMDDPTVQWSQERYLECCKKITPFLKQVGYNPKTDVHYIPVSAYTGANIKDRLTEDVCKWYKKESLLEYLDNIKIPTERNVDGPLLIPITDKNKDMGTIISGKIESGKLKKGQNVIVMPNKKPAEILQIYYEENETQFAVSGDNVRIKLKGIEEDEISPGFVICSPDYKINCVTSFEAQLAILEYKNIICAGYSAVLHLHACVEDVSITALLHSVDKKTGKKSKHAPRFLKQGDVAIVRLETSQMVCAETYADFQQLGRFTIRDEGKTIAIGKITKLLFD